MLSSIPRIISSVKEAECNMITFSVDFLRSANEYYSFAFLSSPPVFFFVFFFVFFYQLLLLLRSSSLSQMKPETLRVSSRTARGAETTDDKTRERNKAISNFPVGDRPEK